eukprot:IDg15924t1
MSPTNCQIIKREDDPVQCSDGMIDEEVHALVAGVACSLHSFQLAVILKLKWRSRVVPASLIALMYSGALEFRRVICKAVSRFPFLSTNCSRNFQKISLRQDYLILNTGSRLY